jgi:branched-subunit amino acid aminotransferase/4-amino-4-deoxychorismate lyase
VVWPDAPMLHGITMQLLERELAGPGLPSRRSTVRLRDIASLDGAFLCSAHGIAAVTTVDHEPSGRVPGLEHACRGLRVSDLGQHLVRNTGAAVRWSHTPAGQPGRYTETWLALSEPNGRRSQSA